MGRFYFALFFTTKLHQLCSWKHVAAQVGLGLYASFLMMPYYQQGGSPGWVTKTQRSSSRRGEEGNGTPHFAPSPPRLRGYPRGSGRVYSIQSGFMTQTTSLFPLPRGGPSPDCIILACPSSFKGGGEQLQALDMQITQFHCW